MLWCGFTVLKVSEQRRFSEMVIETRAQELAQARREKALEAEESMESQMEKIESKIDAQNLKIERHISEMFEAIHMLSPSKQSNLGETHQTARASSASATDVDYMRRQGHANNHSGVTRLGKLDFPRFSGEKVKEWLFKVDQFFAVDPIPEEMRVSVVSIHLDGLAATWHQNMIEDEVQVPEWGVYKARIRERFEMVGEDPIAELKKLQETAASIDDYHAKFEAIRTRVRMTEDYLVSAYLVGLRIETQMHIRMFQPQTVRQCLMLGRLYETAHPVQNNATSWKNNKATSKGQFSFKKDMEQQGNKPAFQEKPRDTQQNQPRRFLSTEEMSARRAKGLCYFCDEQYTSEHYKIHKKTQLFVLEMEDAEEVFLDAEEEHKELVGEVAHISTHAMEGISTYNTMRVKGTSQKRSIFMLVDSGSTHNFMDPQMAKKLGCSLLPSDNARVRVADGYNLKVIARIQNFKWEIHNTTFVADFMVIPLKGIDAVLGVHWLKPLGPITWDFTLLTMQFKWDKKRVMIHGIQPSSVRAIKADKLNKLRDSEVQLSMLCVADADEDEGEVLQLSSLTTEVSPPSTTSAISQLLDEYKDVFAEPKGLPPSRTHHDHPIPLIEGTNPVNMRPYRYANHQKDEIDKIVKDMLESGIIQPSSSSFASPVVLVKKKDGSWRLCVDYRKVNGITVKNCFPIPLIEDLMDELGGAVIFSKFDLRAGYHQVRMVEKDIPKTAFKTHSGHFEYLVMPFGLTNALATFQGLMNSVFQKFLRKFVLVFFDDILIYSKSKKEHLQHLKLVLEVMREHKLFAKRSNCAFATSRVEYLGHFIDRDGLSTDPSKVLAVKEWPAPTNLKQLRGFLGLANYYRRFVKNFGAIARPLTLLTKKDAFLWSPDATVAF